MEVGNHLLELGPADVHRRQASRQRAQRKKPDSHAVADEGGGALRRPPGQPFPVGNAQATARSEGRQAVAKASGMRRAAQQSPKGMSA
jgi:hypothetical protein